MTKTSKEINIFTENEYSDWQIDEKEYIDFAKSALEYFMDKIMDKTCLDGQDFDTVSFDILYCNGEKTHQINREYRDKDYVADIITFAIFADSADDEKFVFDGEINLGEIILALDKVIASAQEKGVTKEHELRFLIAHGIMHLLGFDHQTEDEYNFIVKMQNEAIKNSEKN